ncbi:MAG TPA: twin-arginine translocase TatA/TatE family subunit [Acidimicrobiia bacterium]|nr:twin-arginine translocase TatA/TatE family subunit [Acidimicrobiia bacterium]
MGEGLFSPWHIAIIAFVVFMVFGPKKIADRFTDLSQGVQEWIENDGEGGAAPATDEAQAAPPPPKKVKLSRRIGQRLYRLRHRRRRAPL